MRQQIIDTLMNSTVNNQSVVKEVEQIIEALSLQPNYCLALMEIVDDQTILVEIRLAALIQLKNNVQRRWLQFSNQSISLLSAEEKSKIKQTLLTAMIRCQVFPSLLRIYQNIVTLVVIYECDHWMPTQEVVNAIATQPQNLNVIVLFVQSVLKAFSERPKAPKEPIEKFNREVFVLLYQAVTGELKSIPLIYLVVKALQKAYKLPLSPTMKEYTPMWMPLLKEVIDYEDGSLTSAEGTEKNSMGFYLLKAKKWATKIIEIFFRTYSLVDFSKTNEQFVKQWIEVYSGQFIISTIAAFSKPNLSKTYYYFFKIIAFALSRQPLIINEFSEKLLYEIIPPFAKLVPEDEHLAKNDPLELFKKEEDLLGLDGNPKYAAISLWACLVEVSCDSKKEVEGPNIRKSLEWVYAQICSDDLLTKEMGMNLYCRTSYVYLKFLKLRAYLMTIIEKAVLPNFTSQVLLVKARAIEVIQEYGKVEFSSNLILQQVIECLYKFLTLEGETLLNIKAAQAFNSVLTHQAALDMVKPYLRELLQSYTKLISENEIESLVAGLEGIINHYGEEIGPFAVDLIAYLSTQFAKFVSRDRENALEEVNDEGQFELAAQACLDVLKQVMNSGIPQQVLLKVEDWIILVMQEALGSKQQEYYQGSIKVLSSYIDHSQTITPKLWFFYPIILYSILGLPQQLRTKQIPLFNPKQTQILNSLPTDFNSVNFEISAVCIKNFIVKSLVHSLHDKDMFGHQMIRILLAIFSKSTNGQNKSSQGILNSASILMYILETGRQDKMMIKIIWNIIGLTLKEIKSITGKKISLQLLCLSLYNNVEATFEILEQLPSGGVDLIKGVFKHIDFYRKQYQLTRIILGISSILLKTNKSQGILKLIPSIMEFLLKMIIKLNEERERYDLNDDESDFEDDADDICYWSQERKDARSSIDNIDANAYVGSVWRVICEKDNTLEQGIKNSFAQLPQLLSNLQRGKQLYKDSHSKNPNSNFKQ